MQGLIRAKIARAFPPALALKFAGRHQMAESALDGTVAEGRAEFADVLFAESAEFEQARAPHHFQGGQLRLHQTQALVEVPVSGEDGAEEVFDEGDGVFPARMPPVLRAGERVVVQALVFGDLRLEGDVSATVKPLLYKSSVVKRRLILPLPSLKGWMQRKSWMKTGMAINGSNSMLPMTRLYSSQILSSASGVS